MLLTSMKSIAVVSYIKLLEAFEINLNGFLHLNLVLGNINKTSTDGCENTLNYH